jgi:hypothetical protein
MMQNCNNIITDLLKTDYVIVTINSGEGVFGFYTDEK